MSATGPSPLQHHWRQQSASDGRVPGRAASRRLFRVREMRIVSGVPEAKGPGGCGCVFSSWEDLLRGVNFSHRSGRILNLCWEPGSRCACFPGTEVDPEGETGLDKEQVLATLLRRLNAV